MAGESNETFKLDVDHVESYFRQTSAVIDRGRAWTANLVAILLVAGLLLSLPLYILALLVKPEAATQLAVVFERWYAVVSPLAGAAIGVYFVTRGETEQGRRRKR
jgi:hypothetical protein